MCYLYVLKTHIIDARIQVDLFVHNIDPDVQKTVT
jgi:hypothetical protein